MTSNLTILTLTFTVLGIDLADSWWGLIPEEVRLIFSLALFLVNLVILTSVMHLAGMLILSNRKARVTDAFSISFLGTILTTVFFLFIPIRLLSLLLGVIVWLLLIRQIYRVSWLRAVMVGLLALVIFLAVTVTLALVFGILYVVFERFFSLFIIGTWVF
jgi:hypothetical protein